MYNLGKISRTPYSITSSGHAERVLFLRRDINGSAKRLPSPSDLAQCMIVSEASKALADAAMAMPALQPVVEEAVEQTIGARMRRALSSALSHFSRVNLSRMANRLVRWGRKDVNISAVG